MSLSLLLPTDGDGLPMTLRGADNSASGMWRTEDERALNDAVVVRTINRARRRSHLMSLAFGLIDG